MIQEIIIAVITATIGYVVGYKKNQNDIEGGRLDNLEKSIRVYQIMIDDLSKKVEEFMIIFLNLSNTLLQPIQVNYGRY